MIRSPAKSVLPPRSGVVLLCRIANLDGELVTQATLTSVTWTLTNVTQGVGVASGTFTISGVVYDDLQMDGRWRKDTPGRPGRDGRYGYNFAGIINAQYFPLSSQSPLGVTAPETEYQVDVAFTPTSGQPFRHSWVWTAWRAYG